MACLEAYEQWRPPIKIDLASAVGQDKWEEYWLLCEGVITELRQCQLVADSLRSQIGEKLDAANRAESTSHCMEKMP